MKSNIFLRLAAISMIAIMLRLGADSQMIEAIVRLSILIVG